MSGHDIFDNQACNQASSRPITAELSGDAFTDPALSAEVKQPNNLVGDFRLGGSTDALHTFTPGRLKSSDELPSFCIALPVYNEAAAIKTCISNIASFLESVPTRTAIVAVDDGSGDETWDILLQLKKDLPSLILERHAQNGGYGAAQRTLCRLAAENHFEYALVMDADGTQAPHFIGNFFDPMKRRIDFVKATRYAQNGSVEGVPWQRYWISRLGNLLAQMVMGLPVTDFSNGFRAIRTEAWARLRTTERNFVVLIEEVYLAKKIRLSFAEVPYVLTVRKEAGSQSKFTYQWSIYGRYLRYVFKR